MRTLSATLEAAQRSKAARPCVQATVDDRHVGVGRLRPAVVYEGAEGDGPCALAACGEYVLRAWTSAAGELRLCRAQAGATSGWDSWALMASGVDAQAQVALAANGSAAYLLYVSGDGRTLLCRRSLDGGQTWATAETAFVAATGHRLASLAAGGGTAHDCICLLVDDAQTGDPDDAVHVAWLRQATWSSALWPRNAGSGATGLAAVGSNGDAGYSSLHFVLCGCFEETTRPAARLYHLQLTAEGQRLWTYRGPVLLGEAPDFTWAWPALVATAGDRPRLFVVQRRGDAGAERLGHLFLMRLGLTGPVSAGDFLPFDGAVAQGAGVAACGGLLYWGCGARVWRSPLYGGMAGQRLDVSANVVSYAGCWPYRGQEGSLLLLLDNSGGEYDAAEPLRLGAQVSLREGYLTASGAEVIYQAPYWVGEIERMYNHAPVYGGQVLLRCYDGWGKLWRSRAQRAHEWLTSPALVLTEALERHGFVYGDDGSPALYCAQTPPRFSLGVGLPWAGLIERLLDYSGCDIRFFVDPDEEETWPSARALVFTAGSEPCYAYAPGGHAVTELGLCEREAAATWAQVYGEGVFGEALDLAAMAALGFATARLELEGRLTADTDVTAEQAAGFALRRYGWGSEGGWLLARPNVGLEPLDVVSLQAGALADERRVLAIERHYDRRSGANYQRLILGGV